MSIKINKLVNMVKSKYAGGRIYGALFKYLVTVSGTLLPLFAFLSCFRLECDYPAVVITVVISALLLSLMISGNRRRNLCFGGILFIFMGIFLYFFRRQLISGILSVANRVLEEYGKYFGREVSAFEVNSTSVKQDITMLVCVAACELTFILITATWYKVCGWIHYMVTLAFVGVIMIVGYMPGMWYTVGILAYMTAVIIASRPRGKKRHLIVRCSYKVSDCISAKAYGVVALILAAVFAATVCMVKPEGYDRNEQLKNTRDYITRQIKKIQEMDLMHGIFGGFGRKTVSSGGMSGGKLGQSGALEFKNVSAMKVTVPAESQGFYIRGFIGTRYAGDHWESYGTKEKMLYEDYGLSSRDWLSATYDGLTDRILQDLYFAEQYQSRMEDSMTIEPTGADTDYFYMPYFSFLGDYKKNFDIGVDMDMPDSLRLPLVDYLIGDDYDELWDRLDIYDNGYLAFLRECSEFQTEEVPDSVIDALFPMEEGENFPLFEGDNYQECIDAVTAYLNENMTYSLNPGSPEEGEDFLERFLFRKKQGFCMHFATLATVIFALEGIPARYVEGYVITPKDYKENLISRKNVQQMVSPDGTQGMKEYVELDIKDSNAHAWTEIYIEGFGWVPVEVTPGYENVVQGEVEVTTEPQETPTQSSTENRTSEQQSTQKQTQAGITPEETAGRPVNGKYLLVILLAIAAALLGILVWKLAVWRQKAVCARLHSRAYRNNIGYVDIYFEKLCRLQKFHVGNRERINEMAALAADKFEIGEEEFVTFYRILDKLHYAGENAVFTGEESRFMEDMLYRCGETAYGSGNLLQKFKIRYIWCIKKK